MDFELSPARQKRFAENVDAVERRFSDSASAYHGQAFDHDRWRAAAELGFTGLCIPESHGGSGFGALDTALGLQAFGRACPDTGLVFGVAAHLLACAVPVRDFGDAEVRDRFLPPLASGELIAANAITEDEAGSDTGTMTTTAVLDGDDYLLDGEKSFASNGAVADLFVTYAVTDAAAGFLGVSAFLVPGPPLEKMGLDGCVAARVRFSGCRIPAGHRLGPPGSGARVFRHSMDWERSCLFAVYVGLMERQLKQCVDHARRRQQFGRRIGDFQAVSHKIAAMAGRLEGARLLLYRACWLLDWNQPSDIAAAVSFAKIAVSEAAVANSLDAVQLFGGAGYLVADGVERQLRDSLPSTIFSGTTEIHREIIARGLGLGL
jgi:clorobiocin biosynthesis protein CloN3